MTTSATLAMLVAALTAQVDMSPLVQEIHDNNYGRIAICPRPIITEGDAKTSVDDITLLATEQIQQITQQLITQSQGEYKVIDPDVALSAVSGMTIDDLSNPEVRRGIGQQTGAAAMLFIFAEVNQESGQWDLFWKLVELEDSTVAVQGTETLDLILSDVAYMGESFEARRWGSNGLDVVGFDPKLPREAAMGVGPEWERVQYGSLQQAKAAYAAAGQAYPHPLESPDVPYGIQLVVNGQRLVPERIGDKLYVAIDPADGPPGEGPDIGIRMFNRCGLPVFMGVYIDGVNMINQQRELPIMTPSSRHWSVRDGYDSVLRNWYHLEEGRTELSSPFVLVEAEQATAVQQQLPPGGENFVAFGDRIDDRIGMITCMVYTNGWDGVDANAIPPKTMGVKPRFGFGNGLAVQAQVNWVSGERGILLAAMTLHYRTPDELDQIRAMEAADGDVIDVGNPEIDQSGQSTVSPTSDLDEPDVVVSDQPELPGEDAPFPDEG